MGYQEVRDGLTSMHYISASFSAYELCVVSLVFAVSSRPIPCNLFTNMEMQHHVIAILTGVACSDGLQWQNKHVHDGVTIICFAKTINANAGGHQDKFLISYFIVCLFQI